MVDTERSFENPFNGWTTLEEASEIVGRDRSTVRYWAEHGKIACFPVGRRVRVVNIAEVKRYSEEVATRKPGSGRYRRPRRRQQ